MEINGKTIAAGVVVAAIVGGIMIGYPAYQRAVAIASLSTKTIDVSLHADAPLESTPFHHAASRCRIRFPAGMPAPENRSIAQAEYAFGTALHGEASFQVAEFDRGSVSFNSYVRGSRLNMKQSLKNMVIEDEGFATINGMNSYVMTYRFMSDKAFCSRVYMNDGGGTKVYAIMVIALDSEWPKVADASDSAASTFEVGDWPEEPPTFARNDPPRSVFSPAPPPMPIPPRASPGFPPSTPGVPPGTPSDMPSRMTPGAPPAWQHAMPSPSPAGPSGNTVIPGPPASPFVEVNIDGKWLSGVQFEEKGDKVRVRYHEMGGPFGEAWVTRDQTRPRTFGSRTVRSFPQPGGAASGGAGVPHAPRAPVAPGAGAPGAPGEAKAELTVDAAAAQLSDSNPFQSAKACEALAAMTPDKEHQPGVIKALAAVLREDNIFTRTPAAKALGVWADAVTEKAFIDRLVTGRKQEHAGIFEMLSARKTPTAAKALARRLRVPDDAAVVEPELKKMGAVAEPAVREMLTDPDKTVRKRAAHLLASIGTRDSLPALTKAATALETSVSFEAKASMEEIQKTKEITVPGKGPQKHRGLRDRTIDGALAGFVLRGARLLGLHRRLGSAQPFGQDRLDRLGPDLVALGVGVQAVGHDPLGKRAVGSEKLVAEVEELHVLAVIELGQFFVDQLDAVHGFFRLLLALGRPVRPPRKNSQQQDFGLRVGGFEFLDDGGVARDDLVVGVAAEVVGADHHDEDLGLHAVELAIFQAPQDVLGAVAADAEVFGVPARELFLPDLLAAAMPAVSDRIPDEIKIDATFFRQLDVFFVPGFEVLVDDAVSALGAGLVGDVRSDRHRGSRSRGLGQYPGNPGHQQGGTHHKHPIEFHTRSSRTKRRNRGNRQ